MGNNTFLQSGYFIENFRTKIEKNILLRKRFGLFIANEPVLFVAWRVY